MGLYICPPCPMTFMQSHCVSFFHSGRQRTIINKLYFDLAQEEENVLDAGCKGTQTLSHSAESQALPEDSFLLLPREGT